MRWSGCWNWPLRSAEAHESRYSPTITGPRNSYSVHSDGLTAPNRREQARRAGFTEARDPGPWVSAPEARQEA